MPGRTKTVDANSHKTGKVVAPVTSLLSADSPRLTGEDPEHVRQLAETEAELPPILVHRPTMRVIDGMHRLEAAILRGEQLVSVEYFDGTDFEAFIMSVRLNITHGLPLTRADREAAAARILRTDRSWSDRAISEVTGLSAPTISGIRARSPATGQPEPEARRGRDGRVRPLSTAEGRRKAGQLIGSRPGLSLRKIAKETGISISTARDVRMRVQRGEDPVPARSAERLQAGKRQSRGQIAVGYRIDSKYVAYMQGLENDPSLRFTDIGRFLLRCLGLHTVGQKQRAKLIESVPEHCTDRIAHMARCCSSWWAEFAADLEMRQPSVSQNVQREIERPPGFARGA
jgi:ParB-like chromosome segregation protein Spo0J